jgi:hypothetical protein
MSTLPLPTSGSLHPLVGPCESAKATRRTAPLHTPGPFSVYFDEHECALFILDGKGRKLFEMVADHMRNAWDEDEVAGLAAKALTAHWPNAGAVAPPPQRPASAKDVPGGFPPASCSPSSELP